MVTNYLQKKKTLENTEIKFSGVSFSKNKREKKV